jgi:ribose 5-phosphate isomerase B
MKLAPVLIASDHRGFALKGKILAWLADNGLKASDLGSDSDTRCDASAYAVKLASALKSNLDARGILICGSGQAMAMTANRYQNLRAALCLNTTMARLAREHNDANVLVLGADLVGEGLALDCLTSFLNTEFLGGRYADRRDYLTNLGGL